MWLICASPTSVTWQKYPALCFLQASGGLRGMGTSVPVVQGEKRQKNLDGFPDMQE